MPLIFRPTALKLPVHKFNKYLQTLLVTEFTFLFSYSANIDVFLFFLVMIFTAHGLFCILFQPIKNFFL